MPEFYTQFNNIEVVNHTLLPEAPGWIWDNVESVLINDESYAQFRPEPNTNVTSDGSELWTPYLRLSGLGQEIPNSLLDDNITNLAIRYDYVTAISNGIGFSTGNPSRKNISEYQVKVINNNTIINTDFYNPYSNAKSSWERYTYSPYFGLTFENNHRVRWSQFSISKQNRKPFTFAEIFDPNLKFDISWNLAYTNYNPDLYYFKLLRAHLYINYNYTADPPTTHRFTSFGNLDRNPYDDKQSWIYKAANAVGNWPKIDGKDYFKLENWEWKNTSNINNRDGNLSNYMPVTGTFQQGGLLPTKYSIFGDQILANSVNYMPTKFLRAYNISPKVTSDKPIAGISLWVAGRSYVESSIPGLAQPRVLNYTDFFGIYKGDGQFYDNRVENSITADYFWAYDIWNSPTDPVSWYRELVTVVSPVSDIGGPEYLWGAPITKSFVNDNEFGFCVAPYLQIKNWEQLSSSPSFGFDDILIKIYYRPDDAKSYIYPSNAGYGTYPTFTGRWSGLPTEEQISSLVELRIQKLDKITTPIPTQENVPVQLLNFKQKIENPLIASLEFIPATHKVGQFYFIDPAISITSQQTLTSGHELDPAAQIRPNSILSQEKFTDLHYLKLAKRIEPQPGVTSQEILPDVHKVSPKIENKPKSIPTSESITNLHSLVRGSNLVSVSVSAVFQEFYSQDRDSSYGSLNYSWANPTNAKYKDNAYAELGWDSDGEEPISQPDPLESDYLYALNLDLSSYDIPDDAQIKGIEVSIYRNGRKIDSYFSYDSIVSLTLDDVLIGENKAKPEYWPYDTQGFVEAVYGSLSDTWGVTLTGADIKKSTFGVALSIAFQYGNIDNIGPEPFADPVAPEHLYGVDSINLTFIYQPPIPPSSIGPVSIPTNETFTNQNELIKTELPVFGCITTNFVDHFSIDRADDNFGSVNYSWFNLEGATALNDNSAAYLNWDGIEAQTTPTEDIYSDYIYLQNILAANIIPDDYEVTGITVKINRKGQSNNSTDWYAYDDTVQLILNDELIGGNKAKTSDIWPKDFEVSQYGGPGDSWGVYLLGSDINDPTFGLAIGIKFNHTNASPYPTGFDFEIDNVEITICYQPVPEDKFIQPLSIETQETTESLDTITKLKLLKTNQDPIFYTRIFSPAYEVGYYDCLAIAKETDISPVNDLTIDSLDTNYLFAANSINLNYAAETTLSNRLAGEGANPNTFKVNSRQLTLDFTIPIRVESWGYVDSIFSAIYDYFILGHKGNATTFVGRFKYSDVEELSGVSELYIDNIADFTGLVTPFEAYIRTDDGGAAETVIVSEVDKTNKKLNLQSSIVNSYNPFETYIWAKGVLIEEDREPAFSLFSLREGLLSGCMVDRITLNMVPGQTLEANVSIKFTNLDRAYQSILLEQFDDIVSNVNKRKPNYLINAATISLESTSTSGGSFLLGSPKESTFFRGFEELNIRDFEINEISLELNNNLQPVYPLRSSSRSYIERFDQNRNPYAYYSNGRSISGTIKYTSPIKPWLFAEKLSGPSRINKSGLVFNFGSFKLTLPEIVWSPQSSNSAMEQNLQKTVSFNVVTNSLTFDPYLEPTGQP